MPRRPTSDDAVKAARFFLEGFIARTNSQDHILPKNDEFSPFSGFCRIFPQCAKKKDGGTATDGVSRAAFNKICLEYFDEGMRKPARNGNPGALESGLAQQRRHFLRGRWLDPADPHDVKMLRNLMSSVTPEQATAATALLQDFSRWKPGPAGRGGERVCRKRSASGSDISDDDESEVEQPPPVKRQAVVMPEKPVEVPKKAAPATQSAEHAQSGLLELLCMVASSVEESDKPAKREDDEASSISTTSQCESETTSSSSTSSTSSPVISTPAALVRPILPEPVVFPSHRELGGHTWSGISVTNKWEVSKTKVVEKSEVKTVEKPAHTSPMCCSSRSNHTSVASLCSSLPEKTEPVRPVTEHVPAPFAGLFRSEPNKPVVDEGMSRYPIGFSA